MSQIDYLEIGIFIIILVGGVLIGFMLQSLFGRRVWTLKDLTNEQLNKIIENCEKIIERNKVREERLKLIEESS